MNKKQILALTCILACLALTIMPFAHAADTTVPTITQVSHSTTTAGASCNFGIVGTDETALSKYIFSYDNGGGTFVDDAMGSFSGSPQTVNISKTLTTVGGKTIRWSWYINDTSNNTATTGTQSFVTVDLTVPVISAITHSATLSGATCTFGFTGTDDTGLSKYIFYFDNGVGTFTLDPAASFSGNPQTKTVTKTLNAADGSTVRWRWYINDTANNTATSAIQSLTTTPTSSQTTSNNAITYYWLALAVVSLIPLLLGAGLIINMVRSEESDPKMVVAAIGSFTTFIIMMIVGIIIINAMGTVVP
jgi:hypothetical protein